VPKEKNSAVSGSDEILDRYAELLDHGVGCRTGKDFKELEFFRVDDERDHDFREYRGSFLGHIAGGGNDRGYLHFEDFGIGDGEPAAAVAEHRIRFMEHFYALLDDFVADVGCFREGSLSRFVMGNELVERRVDEADGHTESVHSLEDSLEILDLERQELGERLFTGFDRIGDDHLADGENPFLGIEEHVFGAAESYALRAELARVDRIVGCVSIGPDLDLSDFVDPFHEGFVSFRELR